jgi:uncharacterized membrane protein
VKEKKVAIEGVILVTHAEDGAVAVRQTGDKMGRKGAAWGAGVGLAVGVFAPPLLAAVGVGAVSGGLIGKFVDHRVEHEIHDKIGENLPPGSAGSIAVFDDEHRFGVEQALAAAAIRSVVETSKQGVSALKGSLAEAMGKFSPDRSVLPIPDPNFGGAIGRTLEASIPDWTINMTPKPPEGARTSCSFCSTMRASRTRRRSAGRCRRASGQWLHTDVEPSEAVGWTRRQNARL